jgi:LysR family transcriptional regulator, glycine cleavage system transcriptional activator
MLSASAQLSYCPWRREKKSHVKRQTSAAQRHTGFRGSRAAGSFVEAAIELNVTHWAVGKQVKLLEEWFGLPLFERRSRGVALTDEGAELLHDVRAAFLRLSEATARLRRPEQTRRLSGVVRVNVQPSFALRWLFPRLSGFQELFPNVDLRISTTSRKLRYVGTAFDIGGRAAPEKQAGLRSEILMPDRRRPACSPVLLRKRPIEGVHDLRLHTILHSATTRSTRSHWLSVAGNPDLGTFRQMELEHVYQQLQAAVEGLGVALASMPLIEGDIAVGRLVCPIAAPAWNAGSYELVTNEDRMGIPAVRAFRDWITTAALKIGRH